MRTLLTILKRSIEEIGSFLGYYFLTFVILIGSLILISSIIEVYERYTVIALVWYLFSRNKH